MSKTTTRTATIRAWALANGYGPGKTGRLSREILDAYAGDMAAKVADAATVETPSKSKTRKARKVAAPATPKLTAAPAEAVQAATVEAAVALPPFPRLAADLYTAAAELRGLTALLDLLARAAELDAAQPDWPSMVTTVRQAHPLVDRALAVADALAMIR